MPYPALDYSVQYGNRDLIVEVIGEVQTDLYGLSTCSLTAKAPYGRLDLVPALFSAHPIFPWLHVERQRIGIKDGFLHITCEYAGVPGNTTPIYELTLGVGEAPIVAHPKFQTAIGGKPSAPLNGAVFIDPTTGTSTTNDSIGVFSYFSTYIGGTLNQFAGIESFIDFSQAVWRMRQYTTFLVADIAYVGKISTPEGPAPSVGGGRNWILQSINYEQRGLVYGVTKEWKASGPRGWNTTIYTF